MGFDDGNVDGLLDGEEEGLDDGEEDGAVDGKLVGKVVGDSNVEYIDFERSFEKEILCLNVCQMAIGNSYNKA